MKRLAALALNFLLLGNVFAQPGACPARQALALANLLEHCAEQGLGAVCLGNATVTPVYRQSAVDTSGLDKAGDTSAIADIDWLSVSSEDQTWGLARALFPAYPSDGFERADVALLAIGNVALFLPEAVQPPLRLVDINVTAAQGANLRAQPSTEAPIIAQLEVSRGLKALGTLRGGAWLLIYPTPNLPGWISQSVVSEPAADLPTLEADSASAPIWLPWQRFDFRSGLDDAPCAGAPESGILLQSAKSTAPRHFEINGARLLLQGTAWLQAQASQGLFVHILDGRARVSTAAGEAALRSGEFTQLVIERAANGDLAAGAPATPRAYDYQAVSSLPIQALPSKTRIALDHYTLVERAPASGGSPLEALGAEARCKFSALQAGANMRSRPDPEAPIIAVMAHRESALPIARGIGADNRPWWKLAERIWVRVDATVSRGRCSDIPLLSVD